MEQPKRRGYSTYMRSCKRCQKIVHLKVNEDVREKVKYRNFICGDCVKPSHIYKFVDILTPDDEYKKLREKIYDIKRKGYIYVPRYFQGKKIKITIIHEDGKEQVI